jgi:hypothetical protein
MPSGEKSLGACYVAFNKMLHGQLAIGAVLPAAVSEFGRDLLCGGPIADRCGGVYLAVDITLNDQSEQPQL